MTVFFLICHPRKEATILNDNNATPHMGINVKTS
jgi:hypothetical protein